MLAVAETLTDKCAFSIDTSGLFNNIRSITHNMSQNVMSKISSQKFVDELAKSNMKFNSLEDIATYIQESEIRLAV